jgi:hypothetical protein
MINWDFQWNYYQEIATKFLVKILQNI